MKKVIISLFVVLILIMSLVATPVLAKDNQSNGAPFQELWDKIGEILDKLDDLQAQITGIQLIEGPQGPQGEPGLLNTYTVIRGPFNVTGYKGINVSAKSSSDHILSWGHYVMNQADDMFLVGPGIIEFTRVLRDSPSKMEFNVQYLRPSGGVHVYIQLICASPAP